MVRTVATGPAYSQVLQLHSRKKQKLRFTIGIYQVILSVSMRSAKHVALSMLFFTDLVTDMPISQLVQREQTPGSKLDVACV